MSKGNSKNVDLNKIIDWFFPVIAVILSLIVGMFIILASGKNPVDAYKALFIGAFGDLNKFGETLNVATPLILTGLGVAIAFKCGLFNIGVEGQLLIGAMASALIGHYVTCLPSVLHIVVTLLGGILAGALWGLLPGVLKAFRGVHEVLVTIMMNYIAGAVISFVVQELRTGGSSQTPDILDSAKFLRFSDVFKIAFNGSHISIGFVIAVIVSILIYILIEKTVLGYELRAVGNSPLAAENGGIKINKNIILVMLISGGLAGLAGADRVMGEYHHLMNDISVGLGFEGMAVALLANNNPIGIIFSGILFGALTSGGFMMQLRADVLPEIVTVIQAIIIFFVAGSKFIKHILVNKKSCKVDSEKKEVRA